MKYGSITKNKQIHYDYIQGAWNDLDSPHLQQFFTFSLNTKQLAAQHTPLLGYTSLLPPRELANGCTEPFSRDVAIPLTDSHLCSFLSTVEAPYPVEYSAVCRCFLPTSADN